jgi:hypothetical protein
MTQPLFYHFPNLSLNEDGELSIPYFADSCAWIS